MLVYTVMRLTLNQLITLVREDCMEYKRSMLRDLSY